MSPAFQSFIAPARAYPQLWRLVLGLMVIGAVYAGWMGMMGVGLWLAAGGEGLEERLEAVARGDTPWHLILLLATFPGMALGVWVAVRFLHWRGWCSLFGRPAVVLRDFMLGVAILAAVNAVLVLVLLPFAPPLERATPTALWLVFLPLALAGILIQTGSEELVFRGYLQQQLAVRFASPLMWLVLPSILFGLAHYAPEQMGANTWLIVAATGLFGLIAADLTARTGALGLAWGLHFANNVMAILVLSAMGGLDGLALFRIPDGATSDSDLGLLILADMALMALVWGICVLWLRRR
ncbi:MAG: CPBP family intramembrane metalloprotease [Pararhodobacter sp.]|nr:CPBP family intramembrane metalloprotease [Pararhodobacter sp.]